MDPDEPKFLLSMIDENERLRLALAHSRRESENRAVAAARLRLQIDGEHLDAANKTAGLVEQELVAKYSIGPEDRIDIDTGKIIRAKNTSK